MEHFTKDGKVICQLCGKPYKIISPTHLKNSHGMSLDTYKEQFSEAPLSSKQFKAQQQFKSKTRKPKEEPKNEKDLYKELIDEEPISPIEELKKEEMKVDSKPIEFQTTSKAKLAILNHLVKKYPNIKESYTIVKHSLSGQLEYSYMTDICDPIEKIDMIFPNAGWHNRYNHQKVIRKNRLESDAWRVIVVESEDPTIKELDELLSNL